jgi:hypothetical protein
MTENDSDFGPAITREEMRQGICTTLDTLVRPVNPELATRYLAAFDRCTSAGDQAAHDEAVNDFQLLHDELYAWLRSHGHLND